MALTQVQTQMLGTGAVLQVVNATYSTNTSSSSSTPIATGLTATITPKFATSKILVMISHPQNIKSSGNANSDIAFFLYKNGSSLLQITTDVGYTGTAIFNYFSCSFNYYDSPATTSATTYASYFANINGNTSNVQVQGSGTPSTITLMEIAG
jgi:hypothetical protein